MPASPQFCTALTQPPVKALQFQDMLGALSLATRSFAVSIANPIRDKFANPVIEWLQSKNQPFHRISPYFSKRSRKARTENRIQATNHPTHLSSAGDNRQRKTILEKDGLGRQTI
jgi:hypothetical protein